MSISIPLFLVLMLALNASSCGAKNEDERIHSEFEKVALKDGRFSGRQIKVEKGVVHVSGSCPTETCRTNVEQMIKEIRGVKSVVNEIHVDTFKNSK